MRSISENNKILRNFNYKIFVFQNEFNKVFSIVKVSGKGNWFERLARSDVVTIVLALTSYLMVCKKLSNQKEEMKAKNGSK